MDETLKPCPFCGSTNIARHIRQDGDISYTECQCVDCAAVGPDDCEGLNWNTRTALAAGEARPVQHKPGCDALGGYGHGIGPCQCGAAPPQPAEPSGWIKCSERMPDDFQHVMVIRAGYERGHSYYLAYRARGRWIKDDIHCMPLDGITHWMPLPQPPEGAR